MTANIQSVKKLDFVPTENVFPSPLDWRDVFLYFLLVDRFDNNQANIPAYDPDLEPIGRDPEQGKVFQGGNLKGIIRRLDYIKGLGANAIWLSPIFKNRQEMNSSYHGYGIQDFLEIDQRFGDKKDLQDLVREAHALGIYIILDIVLNHTGDNWMYPGGHPYYYWKEAPGPFDFGGWREMDPGAGLQKDDAVWPLELQDPDCYKRRGEITDWNDHDQIINGDFGSSKELNINKQCVLDTLIKIYKYWIAVADVDGFRVDTVKHMESSETAIFCNAIREYAKSIGKHNFFIFGEIVADDQTIQQYIGRNSRIEGTNERFPSLDAALDFPLYSILEDVIKGFASPSLLRERYEQFKTLYADHGEAGRYFVTFVDNHDQLYKPYRRFMHQNSISKQVVMAIGYLLTSQGIPCIYYGTEQGFNGGGPHDHFVRECMFGGKWGAFESTDCHFFNPKNQIYKEITKISTLRHKEPALRYGRQYFRQISPNGVDFYHPADSKSTLAYSRILDTTELLVAMNLEGTPRDDFISVDTSLNTAGEIMVNLLDPGRQVMLEQRGPWHAVRTHLEGYEVAIFRKLP